MKNLTLFVLAIFVLSACNKEEPKSSEEAKAAIQSMSHDLNNDVIDLLNSDGVESLSTLMDFMFSSSEFGDLGLRTDEQKIRLVQLANLFGTRPAARVSSQSTDEMPTGVYHWNTGEQDFIFIEAANVLILKFPVGDSETINGVFTLSELTFDENELPTAIEATIHVDDNLIASLSLEANWSADGMPEMANVQLLLKPFYLSINFDNTGANTTLYASLAVREELIVEIDLVAVYPNQSKEVPNKIEGSVRYREVKIAGSVNLFAAMQNENGNPNEFINLNIFVSDQKIGKIIFILESDDDHNEDGMDYMPYIKYNDGSTESLEDLFEGLFDEIEDGIAGI